MTAAIVVLAIAIYGLCNWRRVHEYAGWRWSLLLLLASLGLIVAGWIEIAAAT